MIKRPPHRVDTATLFGRLAVLLLAGAGGMSLPLPAADEEITPETRRAIEAVLRGKATSLLAEKNAEGASFKRGSWSRSFRPAGPSAYQVGFHRDTAEEESLLTERLLLTVTADASSRDWTVVSEEVQDTQRVLFRGVVGDEEFQRFDSFAFEREGLKVTAGRGSLYKDFRLGKVERLTLVAASLSFDYTPPVEQDRRLFEVRKKEKEASEALLFAPEFAHIHCDPFTCEQILASSFTGLAGIPKDRADEPLRKRHDESVEEARKARREDGFVGFRLPFEPDNRYYTISLWREKPDHRVLLEYDDEEPEEVLLAASGFGSFRYYSEETRKGGLSPEELERRPDIDGRDYDLESIRGAVELGFGDGELLVADLTFGLRPRRELQRVFFRVAQFSESRSAKKEARNPRLTINSIQDQDGRELTWLKTGPVSGLLFLPEPAPPGHSLTLRVQFENKDSIYKLTPSYSYVDREGWLPFVRFGDMIHDLDLTLKVPVRYKTLGVGKRVSETKEGDASVTRWIADSPIVFPTVIYGTYREDKASFKATRKDGQEIPLTIHVDRDTLGVIAPKALRVKAEEAANSLNLYREVFGVDYPYSKLDLVNSPQGLSGQSPSSIVYLGDASFLSQGVLGTIAGAVATKFTDSLVAHEVAHQWWGSLIAPANARSYWWVESLSEYSSALYVEQVHGRKAYQEKVNDWRRSVIEDDSWRSVQDGSGVYTKGPFAFHIMRSTWGDEVFFKFLKNLANELKGKEIVSRDIQKVAEGTFGANLEWFFDQWIRGVGLPELTFSYRVTEGDGGAPVLEAEIEQRIMKGTKPPAKEVLEGLVFEGITAVTLVGRSGKEYKKRVILEGPKTSFKVTLPEKPKEIILNKYGEILAYDVIVKERT